LRGGSFDYDAHYLRAAYRVNDRPVYEYNNVGFRVVWSLAGVQT
jgi:formylglycine-generating enzyme required for sulfatase activity